MTTYGGRDFWNEHVLRWPTVPLRKVAHLGTGHTPSRSEPDYWINCNIPWVTTADLTARLDSGLQPLMDTSQHISELGLANSAAVLHPTDTVMLSRTASIGHSVRIGRPMATTQAFVTWFCGPRLDPRYLLLVMNAMKPEFDRLAYGSTHLTIYFPDIEQLRVPLPPIEVQRTIADYLATETARIDSLIEKKQLMIERLEERFESFVFTAVTQGIGHKGPTRQVRQKWVREIPAHWGMPTVSMNFELQLGKMLNAESAEGPEQFPYLRNINVQWDRFDVFDLATMHFGASDRARCELRPGDVLVCEGGEVGRAAVWAGALANCYFQKAIHRVRPRSDANGRFLMYCLRAAAKQSVFNSEGNTSTIVHLTSEQLAIHRFPWPPPDEQKLIVEALDAEAERLKTMLAVLQRQIELLREHRQALIAAAVTGEIEVPGVAA